MADSRTMRATNRALLLDLLRQGGAVTRSQLAGQSALAKPTVSDIVDALIEEGIVREDGPAAGHSRGGPRGRLIALNPEAAAFVGIHLGVRQTSLAVADALGNIRITRSVTPYVGEPARALRELPELVTELVGAASFRRARIGGIGVAVPGLVNHFTGTCVFAPNLGWRNVDLRSHLTRAISVPVNVQNSMQAGATAEVSLGGHERSRSFVWVYVEDGIGAAIVTDGRVFYGMHGYTGEIGHWKVAGEGALCACGRRGCLETVASGPAIEAAARTLRARENDMGGPSAGDDAPALAVGAGDADRDARMILARAGEYLGVAISHVVSLLDLETVVLDGPVIRACGLLVETIRGSVARQAIHTEALTIVRSVVGGDTMLKGAVFLAMEVAGSIPSAIFARDVGRHS